MSNTILRELAKARAVFQQRAIIAVIDDRPLVTNRGDAMRLVEEPLSKETGV